MRTLLCLLCLALPACTTNSNGNGPGDDTPIARSHASIKTVTGMRSEYTASAGDCVPAALATW